MVTYIDIDSKRYEIPEWVCWVAQDADGTWWAYEVEPNQSHSGWYENEVGDSVRLASGQETDEWSSTLKRVK